MREIVILIPDIEARQNVEIDVRINGKKQTLKYRVELLEWEGCGDHESDRVTILKQKLQEYDKDWQLMEIGAPSKNQIPLVFKKKKVEVGED